MRSRFTAFCRGNIDYLIASHHPSQRRADDQQQLSNSIDQCEWLNLSIQQTLLGQIDDNTGEVEYIALYKQQGQLSQLHENSRFVKEGGQWFYLNGDINLHDKNADRVTVGRNDSCWCGSGKKFKKCHY